MKIVPFHIGFGLLIAFSITGCKKSAEGSGGSDSDDPHEEPVVLVGDWLTVDDSPINGPVFARYLTVTQDGIHTSRFTGTGYQVRSADLDNPFIWSSTDVTLTAPSVSIRGLSFDTFGNLFLFGRSKLNTAAFGMTVFQAHQNQLMNWSVSDYSVPPTSSNNLATAMVADASGVLYYAATSTIPQINGVAAHGIWTVRKSVDHGNSWITVDSFQAHPQTFNVPLAIAISPQGEIVVAGYVYDSDYMIYSSETWIVRRSKDSGNSWQTSDIYAGSDVFSGSYESYPSSIVFSNSGAKTYIVGTVNNRPLIRTSNDLATWSTAGNFSTKGTAGDAVALPNGALLVVMNEYDVPSNSWHGSILGFSPQHGYWWTENDIEDSIENASVSATDAMRIDPISQRIFTSGYFRINGEQNSRSFVRMRESD